MKISHIVLIVCALAGFAVCYTVGFRAGAKLSPLQQHCEGDLLLAVAMYQSAQATNWTKVKSTLGMEVLQWTRDYQKRFGVPTGTNVFARHFPEAQAIADTVERTLVPMSSILTNFPHTPDAKFDVSREER
jgi:hypothetical protein